MADEKPIRKIAETVSKPFSKVLEDALRQSNTLQAALEVSNTMERLSVIGIATRASATIEAAMRHSSLALPKTARSYYNKPRQIKSVSDIGAAIRVARKSQNLTQQNFADLVGVGRRFLSELESGKPTLEIGKVLQVAAAAGLHLTIVNNSDE